MGGANFLNIEYILLRAYTLVTGIHVGSFSDISSSAAFWLMQLAVFGMILSLILLIMIVYAAIRLLQVEHAGFHGHEHTEHEPHEALEHAEVSPYNRRWNDVVTLANSSDHGNWRRAILEADILLASALEEQGYTGDTVSEQLRMANPIQMTTLDLAWKAHKVRNQIAHEGESLILTERDVQSTIDYYRRVFEELGII